MQSFRNGKVYINGKFDLFATIVNTKFGDVMFWVIVILGMIEW